MERILLNIFLVSSYLFSDTIEVYTSICDSNWNVSNIPKCKKTCPDLNLSEGFTARCKDSEQNPISCIEATDSSTLSFNCPFGYEIPEGVKSTIQCRNGAWELPTPECRVVQDHKGGTEKPEQQNQDTKVVCYFDSRRYVPGVRLNASLCTHLVYRYIGISLGGDIVIPSSSSGTEGGESLYDMVRDMKRRNKNLKLLLSVTGQGINDQDEFPTVAADPVKRSRFIGSVIDYVITNEFDGIDIYWHFPSEDHKEYYTVLLQELGELFRRRGKLLTATVYLAPTFLGYNISAMNDNLNWINIKCYEHYNEFSRYTGQNSALFPSSTQGSYEADNLNIQACGNNWNYYGIKKNKIVVGITFFGRYYTLLDPTRHGLRAPVTGTTNSNYTGLVSYSEICQKYGKWRRVWDDEQKNPYKYYQDKWVGYDDPESVRMKAAYINKMKYAGVSVFSIDADDVKGNCGAKQDLLKQVNDALNN